MTTRTDALPLAGLATGAADVVGVAGHQTLTRPYVLASLSSEPWVLL
jgi:hypothetical protein